MRFGFLASSVIPLAYGFSECADTTKSIADYELAMADGRTLRGQDLLDKVVIFVNVATECGYTNANYAAFQKFLTKYKGYGVEIIGLPCNQFGGQEPYPEEEIESHLNSKGLMLTFPLMKKGAVLGATGLPLFQWLQEVCGGGAITWNFEKFLISRSGKPSRRFLPSDDLNDVESHLRQLIHDKGRSDL
eukprot:GEMP01083169.1.p1 GENE.GEMP01083169.1~~GEMP01083169.1.p1  ORF type:complete len:189 (+),score=37.42 GEMP01083169.1:131-697(+)